MTGLNRETWRDGHTHCRLPWRLWWESGVWKCFLVIHLLSVWELISWDWIHNEVKMLLELKVVQCEPGVPGDQLTHPRTLPGQPVLRFSELPPLDAEGYQDTSFLLFYSPETSDWMWWNYQQNCTLKSLKLHLQFSRFFSLTGENKNGRRRVWWCCRIYVVCVRSRAADPTEPTPSVSPSGAVIC